MLKVLLARIQQGYRTMKFPRGAPPPMSDRFRGRPEIGAGSCAEGCEACVEACPTGALTRSGGRHIDLGKCLFCVDCEKACPQGAISFTKDYRLAVRERAALVLGEGERPLALAIALDKKLRRLFGQSLKLRQVSAGGCGACEADSNVLTTIGWDMGRFGIQFVASPRHADALLVTGPVTKNMELALLKTYAAMSEPRLVIAAGACAISGGSYIGRGEAKDGVASLLPVDLFIPGCPPHPLTILDGLLRLLGRIEDEPRGRALRGEVDKR
jgi:Ni,Fe-hydrogenase III small subunit/NAD-dependent dihydropyrimidine dehydrogenase PreA subunit